MRGITHIKLADPTALTSEGAKAGLTDGPGGGELDKAPVLSETADEELERSAALSRLKVLPLDEMRDVARLDMLGDFGSKINFLVKHLLLYKITRPNGISMTSRVRRVLILVQIVM